MRALLQDSQKQVVEGYLIGVTSACFAASCRKNSLQRLCLLYLHSVFSNFNFVKITPEYSGLL